MPPWAPSTRAEMALADAQTALSDANTAAAEEMTVSGLVDDAVTATADITDESTPAEVAAGRAAIDAAKESLGGVGDGEPVRRRYDDPPGPDRRPRKPLLAE